MDLTPSLRQTGMRPPESFLDELRKLDPKLLVGWDGNKARWLIARPRETGPGIALILVVQEPDGAYRPLDRRTITLLNKFDSWAIGKEAFVDQIVGAMDDERSTSFDRTCESLGEAHDKARWALRRDIGDYVLGVDRQQQMAFERHTEERLRALRASW